MMKTETEWVELAKILNEELKEAFPSPEVRKDVLVCLLEQIGNDLRTAYIRSEKKDQKTEEKPPTEKQIEFAKKLGIENPEKYSRKELSKLIDSKKR